MQEKWVLLDRDGVINYDSKDFIRNPESWQAIPGSLEAIAKLNQAGYKIAVITNQSGIGRNFFTEKTLNNIHNKFRTQLEQEYDGKCHAIYFCPHKPEDDCECRKPKTGLIKNFFNDFKINTNNLKQKIFFIGDSLKDMQAAIAANCQPLLVETGNGKITKTLIPDIPNEILCFANLYQAAQYIINSEKITL